MTRWTIDRLPEVESDLKRLDLSVRKRVFKAVQRVSQNPLPVNEGGSTFHAPDSFFPS